MTRLGRTLRYRKMLHRARREGRYSLYDHLMHRITRARLYIEVMYGQLTPPATSWH